MVLPPFVLFELMMGAVVLSVAVFHLMLAWHSVRRKLNVLFFLLGVLVAGGAFAAPWRYLSASIPDLVFGIKLMLGLILAYAIALVWFAREYAGIKERRIAGFLTGLGAFTALTHLLLPHSMVFDRIWGIRSVKMLGGGTMNLLQGTRHPLLLVGNLYTLLTVAYLAGVGVVLWRKRESRGRALAYSIGIGPLLLVAYPYGLAVNRGWVDGPALYTHAFIALALVMSHDIVRDAVKSIALSREIVANERKWRSLLESVSLLVVACDREGIVEYANPHLQAVTGCTQEELVGGPFSKFLPPGERAELEVLFEKGIQGEGPEQLQAGLLGKDGDLRRVHWWSAVVRGQDGEVTGLLSVGIDLTEKLTTERARDAALAELKALKEQLEAENQYLRLEFEGTVDSSEFVGKSDAVKYVLHKIAQVASTTATVLIEGETGVGKELVARAIHKASVRSQMPFVRVNCAALPPSLIESELFGHERGAFTGADRAKQGRFELAEGGTLLLDEIGELALDVQAKLLRVLQEGEFDRVGGTKTRRADVRVIASTNRNLKQDVISGRFREDLYYRLMVFPISVPPLRERREDIPMLAHFLVQRLSQKHGRPVREIPMSVIRQLTERDWPGNVRELENVLERAVITSQGQVLTMPSDVAPRGNGHSELDEGGEFMTLDAMERRHIEQTLKRTHGQIAGPGGAAEILGLHPNTLRGRMAKLGVKRA